jgi:hypothetical protein
MRAGALVVYPAVHAYNFSPGNVAPHLSQLGEAFLEAAYGLQTMLSPEGPYRLGPEEVLRDWSAVAPERLLFLESDVDAALYHSPPRNDLFADGVASLEKGVELQHRAPPASVRAAEPPPASAPAGPAKTRSAPTSKEDRS